MPPTPRNDPEYIRLKRLIENAKLRAAAASVRFAAAKAEEQRIDKLRKQATDEITRGFQAGNTLVPFWHVAGVLTDNIERHEAVIVTDRGEHLLATGFDAIEVVWWFKPSALEGRRLRWVRHAWAFHNIVAHPLMQVLAWLGMRKTAIRLHDATTPRPRL